MHIQHRPCAACTETEVSSLLYSFGDQVVSCDADGVIKLWDARMVAETGMMEAGRHSLNAVCLDRSATRLAAASNDATVKASVKGRHGVLWSG